MRRHCPVCGFVNCVCDELEELDEEDEEDGDFDRDELGEDPEEG
jgi:hypothetical protein